MNQADLDARLRAGVRGKAPGAAIVVVGPEGVRASSAGGLADLSGHLPMTIDVAVPWFSMTKITTATTVVRLAERGELQLDEPVYPLVPAMRRLEPSGWAQPVSLKAGHCPRRFAVQATSRSVSPCPRG